MLTLKKKRKKIIVKNLESTYAKAKDTSLLSLD